MFRFENLDIWKDSISYANKCYGYAKAFPDFENYALSSQLRRAAISISNNIVEGSGSDSNKMFCRFINIAINSLYETINILIFAELQGYINEKEKKDMYEKAEVLVKRIKAFRNTLNN